MNDNIDEHIAQHLREAAEAHRPDRARMLARVQRGAAGPAVRHRQRSGLRSWPRAALASLAAAGILATGGLAVAAIVRTPPPAEPTVAPAVPSPTPTPTPSATPSAVSSTPAKASAPAVTPRPTPSASSRPQFGPLWSQAAVDAHSSVYWSQQNLTLRSAQPLTSLTVELRIAQTGGVRDTGNWRTLPDVDFTVTAQESGGVLVYRWVLKSGRTVPTGQHEFAAQFNHATGARDAANDSYRVDGRSAAGPATVWGGFAPAQ